MVRGLLLSLALAAPPAFAQTPAPAPNPALTDVGRNQIRGGAAVFIEPMDGFDTSLSAALLKKKVPLLVVDDRSKADYVISGASHIENAGWAKTIFISPNPHAEASIKMNDARTGALLFAYSVDKPNAARGNQSTAEACAKHLKEAIGKQ